MKPSRQSNPANSAASANQAARCDDNPSHVSKATLAYKAKAKLKQDIEVKQKQTPDVSVALKPRCLDAAASAPSHADNANEVVGEVK